MMRTPNELRGEIERLLKLLLEAEIALYINPTIENKGPQGFTRITWPQSIHFLSEIFREDFTSIDDYCKWLEAKAFSMILYDGSFIQITYDFLGNDLVSHRLAYYPCPFDLDQDLLNESPILDIISLYRGKDNSIVKLRSPIRFDYDLKAQSLDHPAVHMTFIFPHCRWAVVAPISPGHFIRFVFKNFYPHLWNIHEFVRKWPQRLFDRKITIDEEELLHISCKR